MAPPPPPSPSPSPSSPVDAALEKLKTGHVAFNNPDKMILHREQVVTAILSAHLTEDELKARLTDPGLKESAALKIADRMIATLTGGTAFDISPAAQQTQLVSQDDVTTWTWTITAKVAGKQALILTFDVPLQVDGQDGYKTVQTFRHTIDVTVGMPTSAGEWFDVGKTWIGDLQWLWAAIALPAVGAFAFLRKRFKKPDTEKPEPDTSDQAG